MKTIALSLVAAIGLAGGATAQGMSMGQFEFHNSCEVCHGAGGKGDGEFSQLLSAQPADLTMLQKNNGGVFPVQRVFETIDGQATVAAHGERDMPIWGQRYIERAGESYDYAFSPKESAEYSRARMLALVEYIATLQAK